ncbi:1-aminocyclopropane-1-carboxylate deaminase/D-cysteine desulfhydrase [Anabaena sp. FACHB-709]|uniref:1-aminocyclopropane-1-carboxylate deaminase/D-cysteine desulfhydrase n=2 Tax=Nostocaceae TaxID=1162 RepID=A0ABR7ZQQ5_ANACY|nr:MULTISPECIES: 1-aminocyclopropane-1-carboxylate deaminase/D-cysteine desulfhydrase [Nostocaceae]BAY70059.1 putative 1-aminocyclopropane-1-carboxylate deaminase [Trichormus variabilis NIES-23]HBW28845.1 1-aminocyclopropane-1-carboxylate deaminase/D-cysteine desulfhydrase [Nostoc sp. UBA8866]MBD2175047.1 1-aminocyclopropane-1-carboxylate deaminase/D-cysteine desulfhydrase [Anabaena cylindrica FACHB-318]MBD2266903.1 1-aminocyclopropane-1-carboxylate deaminase/D-cysteine desulfhydrase [Anabaena 
MSLTFVPPPIQKINSEIANNAGVEIYVLRLDLMHPWVNGNKWYKLKYNLLEAKEKSYTKLLTFGGAYSNHIFATAAAGNLLGFQTIGIIRGEETLPLNPTLSFATQQGMQLVYVDRETYRQRNSTTLHTDLRKRFGEVFIIPEGGSNLNGVRGCLEIISAATQVFDIVCVACGTATTLAGIALALEPQQRVIGFPVLKNGGFLAQDIAQLMKNYVAAGLPISSSSPASWELVCDYHFGGYAKVKDDLILFSHQFTQSYGVPLDYVYTAKMFYGVMDLLKQRYFTKGDGLRPTVGHRILMIHTGGLQGNIGMSERL